jgi:hypothetical protein
MRLRSGLSHGLEVEHAGGRTHKRGQFMLAVDDCRHISDDLICLRARRRLNKPETLPKLNGFIAFL